MNTSAIEATLQRLRALAGTEGVSSPAAYGWFGFLDVLGPPQERSSPERCSTPSTALSDLSESDSPLPQALYRPLHSRLRPLPHKPYYKDSSYPPTHSKR